MIDSNHVHATGDGAIREIYYPGSVSEYLLPSEAFDPSVQGTSAASRQKHRDWWDNCPRNMISISCDLIAPEIKASKRFVII
jgi:hypothetical protein